jgi:hypothetical protein
LRDVGDHNHAASERDIQQLQALDQQPGLLATFSDRGVRRIFAEINVAAGKAPQAPSRIDRPACHQQQPRALDQHACRNFGIDEHNIAAAGTGRARLAFKRTFFERCGALWAKTHHTGTIARSGRLSSKKDAYIHGDGISSYLNQASVISYETKIIIASVKKILYNEVVISYPHI